jgi:hypothetical protein
VNTQLSTSILPQLQPPLELIEQIQQNQKEQNLQKIDEENENNYIAKISSNKSKHQSSGSINRSASRSVSSNEYEYESIDRKIEDDDEDLKGNSYYLQQIYSNNNNNGGVHNAKANNIYNV